MFLENQLQSPLGVQVSRKSVQKLMFACFCPSHPRPQYQIPLFIVITHNIYFDIYKSQDILVPLTHNQYPQGAMAVVLLKYLRKLYLHLEYIKFWGKLWTNKNLFIWRDHADPSYTLLLVGYGIGHSIWKFQNVQSFSLNLMYS